MSLKSLTKVGSLAVVLIAIPLAASAQARVVRVGPGARRAPVAVTVVGARPGQRVIVTRTPVQTQWAEAARQARAREAAAREAAAREAAERAMRERARDAHRVYVAPPRVVFQRGAPAVRHDPRDYRQSAHGRERDDRGNAQRFERNDRSNRR